MVDRCTKGVSKCTQSIFVKTSTKLDKQCQRGQSSLVLVLILTNSSRSRPGKMPCLWLQLRGKGFSVRLVTPLDSKHCLQIKSSHINDCLHDRGHLPHSLHLQVRRPARDLPDAKAACNGTAIQTRGGDLFLTCMSSKASSQALITMPVPTLKLNGLPRSREESNLTPSSPKPFNQPVADSQQVHSHTAGGVDVASTIAVVSYGGLSALRLVHL